MTYALYIDGKRLKLKKRLVRQIWNGNLGTLKQTILGNLQKNRWYIIVVVRNDETKKVNIMKKTEGINHVH